MFIYFWLRRQPSILKHTNWIIKTTASKYEWTTTSLKCRKYLFTKHYLQVITQIRLRQNTIKRDWKVKIWTSFKIRRFNTLRRHALQAQFNPFRLGIWNRQKVDENKVNKFWIHSTSPPKSYPVLLFQLFQLCLRIFQRHFTPTRVDGVNNCTVLPSSIYLTKLCDFKCSNFAILTYAKMSAQRNDRIAYWHAIYIRWNGQMTYIDVHFSCSFHIKFWNRISLSSIKLPRQNSTNLWYYALHIRLEILRNSWNTDKDYKG